MNTAEKTIGGYIELQLPQGKELYPSLIPLNTGRNALEYLLRIKNYSLVYLPYFTCEVLLEPLRKLHIPFRFYHIDQNLNPPRHFEPGAGECMLYTNYFGIMQQSIKKLSEKTTNLIIDNAQAFFCPPLENVDTFYSCRKFFGVPDGAYLHTNSNIRLSLESDISVYRFSHLIKSIDLSIETGYHDYIKNNIGLSNNAIKKMSVLTKNILSGIDYENCRQIRNKNFNYLHHALSSQNELKFDISTVNGPMVYPFLPVKSGIRKALIAKKIFVATYWPNVTEWTSSDTFENHLTENLVALPIDHRYTISDMDRIIGTLKELL